MVDSFCLTLLSNSLLKREDYALLHLVPFFEFMVRQHHKSLISLFGRLTSAGQRQTVAIIATMIDREEET